MDAQTPKTHAPPSFLITKSGENEILKTKGLGDFTYEVQEIDGEDNLFNLCQLYVEAIENFIELGKTYGFIS
jgi:hypothetical protein